MKIKYDVTLNFFIYILSIIFLILIILNINNFMLDDYSQLKAKYKIVTETSLTILDNDGNSQNGQIIRDYTAQKERKTSVYNIEVLIVLIFILVGFSVIILDVNRKVKLIESTMNSGISYLQQLQTFTISSKYLELQRIEDNINTAIESIRDKDEARDKLYQNIIHDFSTPLHIIKGNLELAEQGIDLELETVSKQIDRLEYYVKMNVAMQDYKMEEITTAAIETYVNLLANIYLSAKFKLNIDNEITFHTKIENFYRIIDNLVNNAVKHAKPNHIIFSLFDMDDHYLMCVANDGAPIKPEIIESIFERHTSTSSSGIGLDIVSSIIDDLGYEINVQTTQERTTFKVKIPK